MAIPKFLFLAILFAFTLSALPLKELNNNPFTSVLSYADYFEVAQVKMDNCSPSQFYDLFTDSMNYSITTYEATTDDGYILTMFRVKLQPDELAKLPAEKQSNIDKPVLFVHVLEGSVDEYFLGDQNHSIGHFMVLNGFDVWFGNNRGNKYSRKHTNPDITEGEFMTYSWQELGQYDVPAFYKKIHQELGETKKLIYFGHSQGTTQMFVSMLDSISRDFVSAYTTNVFQLAPIAYLTHFEIGAIVAASRIWPHLLSTLDFLGLYDFMPAGCIKSPGFESFVRWMCSTLGFFCGTFEDIVAYVGGFDSKYDDQDAASRALFHEPSGASTRCLAHYAQMINGGGNDRLPIFRKFDMGSENANIKRYGSKVPPSWNFSDWPQNVKLHLLGGTKDTLGTKPDVDELSVELKALKKDFTIDWMEGWDHATFAIPRNPDPMFDVVKRELGL